jgi:hypothetical protein
LAEALRIARALDRSYIVQIMNEVASVLVSRYYSGSLRALRPRRRPVPVPAARLRRQVGPMGPMVGPPMVPAHRGPPGGVRPMVTVRRGLPDRP